MLGQVVRPGEAFAAHLAVVGPLAGMDAKVPGEVALAAERAAAKQADERPFAGVLTHVELQVLLRSDALTAERASEATLAPVHLVAAARQADHRVRVLRAIVVHRVVVRLADLAGTAGRPAVPGRGSARLGARHLHLDRLAGVLLHARRLRDALLAGVLASERAARLLLLAGVGGRVATGLHLRRFPGAGHLVAPLRRR